MFGKAAVPSCGTFGGFKFATAPLQVVLQDPFIFLLAFCPFVSIILWQ